MSTKKNSNKAVSTSADDNRITSIGRLIRKYKIDELIQFTNVLTGSMLICGPRPLPMEDFIKLNDFEKSAYSLSPGITDFSSIVFSDEGNILKGQKNADVTYNRVIRPWKSRLVLLYMHSASINADTIIIFATALSLLKKRWALNVIYKLAVRQRASLELLDLIKRKGPVPIVQPPTKIKDVIK